MGELPPRRSEHVDDERLSAFLDDELDEDASLEVAHHVAECDDCLDVLEDLRGAREALRSLPRVTPPPDLFTPGLVASATAAVTPRRGLVVSVLVAVLLTVLLAAAFRLGRFDDGDVVPPVDLFVVDHVARVESGPMVTPVSLDTGAR